jgi:cyclophilin family peptidyl-prolyl cis-trans isomerase
MSPQDRKRGREAAHRRAAQIAVRQEARRRQQRMRLRIGAVLAVVVVFAIALVAIAGGGDDDDDTTAIGDVDPNATVDTSDTTEATVADEADPDAPAFEYGTGECAPDEKPETRPDSFPDAFKSCLKEGAEYKAVVGTSEGSFTIDLLPQRAPGTVNNFVQLAKSGWFDGDDFHRVVPGFVNQAGDPVGDPPGTGGPGYTIPDELPADVSDYVPGAVAMANSGPNSGGSQWFVCVDCSVLQTPDYALFGQVTDGMDVVEKINALGTGDGPPSKPVTIVAIEILEDPLAAE